MLSTESVLFMEKEKRKTFKNSERSASFSLSQALHKVRGPHFPPLYVLRLEYAKNK